MNDISLFPTHGSAKGVRIGVEDYLQRVQSGHWQGPVAAVRTLGYGTKEYSDAKRGLPVSTPSGFFPGRRTKAGLKKHSGLIGLDVDAKDNEGIDLAAVRAAVERDRYALACFASVSGVGFLVLVQIPEDTFPAWFEPEKEWIKAVEVVQVSYYEALKAYYAETFGLKTDGSCIDVSRARYVSYDPHLHYNRDADVWRGRAIPQPKPKAVPVPRERPTVASYGETVLQRAVGMVLGAAEGTKHTTLRDAAHLCGGYIASGCLDEGRAYDALRDAIGSREGVESMENAENLIKTGFSKGAEKPVLPPYVEKRIVNYAGSNVSPADVAVTIAAEEGLRPDRIEGLIEGLLEENSGVFWNVEYDERKGKNVVDIQRQKLVKWLGQQGFRAGANGKEAEFFRVQHNVVARVYPIHVAKHTTAYVQSLPVLVNGLERTQIEESVLRAVTALFAPELLRTMEWLSGEFLRDTARAAYFFFRNAWVEVTAGGVESRNYEDLPALVWDTQIKPHDYRPSTEISPFHVFMQNVTGKDADRLLGLQRALGYLMHGYKDIANSRALILMDETANYGKSEGGTGKGLLLQAAEQMVSMVTLPGANFRFDDSFKFELVRPDTKIVFLDEWDAQRLPFKNIFQEITGNLVINRKHEQSFSIPFAESPKFAFGTNQVIVSEGSSHQRRKIEVLITNHYSATHLPIDEFGHRFFSDWDAAQWNDFYNLALGWVSDYLEHGLLLAEFAGLEDRIIAQKAGVVGKEFLELVKELKSSTERIWAKDAWADFLGSSGIEEKYFSLRKFNELMELAGFAKEKCQERGMGLGTVNRYHQIFFTAPGPPEGEASDVTALF